MNKYWFLFSVIMLLIACPGFVGATDSIEIEYTFHKPEIIRAKKDYSSVGLERLHKFCKKPGLPVLPVKLAKILIPAGREIQKIDVIPGKKITLPGKYKIEYGKKPQPIGHNLPDNTTPDEKVYKSSQPFPTTLYDRISTQFLCGYKICCLRLYPVEYIPGEGQISYYPSIKVVVTLTPSPKSLPRICPVRGLSSDVARVKRLVDNPEGISSYPVKAAPLLTREYVIITNEEMKNVFQDFANWKISRGMSTYVETVENIKKDYSGVDTQEKIRNFIKYAYGNWDTKFVLLGGDGDAGPGATPVIPHRGCYCDIYGYVVDNDIPCDLYYGALDGNWDNDGDHIYGEGDSADGGTGAEGEEADFSAEVFVGRICADNAEEAANQINKIKIYEDSHKSNNVLLVGEDLGGGDWGGDTKDEVFEYFPSYWTSKTLYKRDETFTTGKVIAELNSNEYHTVNHCGHSNVNYNMGLYTWDVDGLTNTMPFLAYSVGCYANAFDNRWDDGSYGDDAISEYFTVEYDKGAFAYISNSRYGWYWPGEIATISGDFDAKFFDAIFNEKKIRVGEALQDSKEDLIPLVGAAEPYRWIYFCLNLLGSPETAIISSEDTTTPSAIENLSAQTGAYPNEIDLTWTAPGDDGTIGVINNGSYWTKYSTSSEAAWDTADCQLQWWVSTITPGTLETKTVDGLQGEVTYYFWIKTADQALNWSELSNRTFACPRIDDIVPGVIKNLQAHPGENNGEIKLTWTAPGDDGNHGDIREGKYCLRYSSAGAITPENWDSPPSPCFELKWTADIFPQEQETRTITGLSIETFYWFAIKTCDETAINWSAADESSPRAGSIPRGLFLPGEFVGVAVSSTAIKWSWQDNSDYEDGYKVQSPTSDVRSLPANTSSWVENQLEPNTEYVRYCNAVQDSFGFSSSSDTCYTFAGVPTGLQVDCKAANAMALSWDTNGNPPGTRFGLAYSSDNFATYISTYITFADNLTEGATIVYGLSPSTTYWIRVWAWNEEKFLTPYATLLEKTEASGSLYPPSIGYTEEVLTPEGLKISACIFENVFDTPTITTIQKVESLHPKFGLVQQSDSRTQNKGISNAYEFIVRNMQGRCLNSADFLADAEIRFTYPAEFNPAQESRLNIFKLEENVPCWTEQPDSEIDVAKNIITLSVQGFSIWTLMAKVTENFDDLIVYPNPFRPNSAVDGCVKFINIPEEVELRIYNIAGELLYTQHETSTNGAMVWEGDNAAGRPVVTGIYIYLLEDNDRHKAVGKFSLIR